jgi:hypothetical protein
MARRRLLLPRVMHRNEIERRVRQEAGIYIALRPNIAARYYIHVTEIPVAAGFGKFVEYHTKNVAEGIAQAFPEASSSVQRRTVRKDDASQSEIRYGIARYRSQSFSISSIVTSQIDLSLSALS